MLKRDSKTGASSGEGDGHGEERSGAPIKFLVQAPFTAGGRTTANRMTRLRGMFWLGRPE
ncbi:hypothetical protein LB505_002286 [Fusarium chuoi]|nr:hypothetical protein LB505_002286 [Fusarium chuoi]